MKFTWKVNRYAHENTGQLARMLEKALNDLEEERYSIEKIEFCVEQGGKSVLVVAKKQMMPDLPTVRPPPLPYAQRAPVLSTYDAEVTLPKTDVRK